MKTHSRHPFFARAPRGAVRLLAALLAAAVPVHAAPPSLRILADVEIDPNAAANFEENGDVLAHYAVPIPDGSTVYTELKEGDYTHLTSWESQSWGIHRWDWRDGALSETWRFRSDWKPVPYAGFAANPYGTGPLWEPVFQAASAGDFLWVPAARGKVFEVRKSDGAVKAEIDPLPGIGDAHTFVAGPIVASPTGIYFNVIRLDASQPWNADVVDSWLIRIAPDGNISKVSYSGLVAGAPAPDAPCETRYSPDDLPFPAPPGTPLPTIPCGTQRTALNLTPAFGDDGTVYTVSRAHFDGRYGYLIALGADLSFHWAATLRDRLHDGCNAATPPTGTPGGCRAGAADGVDPATGGLPAGVVDDTSSSSPVVTPDGGVLYGANTRYNFAQGHLMKFSASGAFRAAYGFGWDTTPVIYRHDGTYSIVMKENRYDTGSYCGTQQFCPTPRATFSPADPDAYFVTRLDPSLAVEWRYRSVNTESCVPVGRSVQCVSDHPRGFEFCVNLVAISGDGSVYANSEDGNLYVISKDGAAASILFLGVAVGAAYTPVVLGPDGLVYTQNFGRMIVAGPPQGCGAAGSGAGERTPICSAPAPVPVLIRSGRP